MRVREEREHERWKCRTQRRPAALSSRCVPQGVVVRSLALSFSLSLSHILLSLYPFWTFLFPLHNSRVQCVRACVREAKFAQRGYGYITRSGERRPSARRGRYTTTRQRRVARCTLSPRSPRGTYTNACVRVRTYEYLQKTRCTYILYARCTCTRTTYTSVCTWACPSIPRGSLLLARTREKPSERTSERTNERTNQPASQRASQPASQPGSQPRRRRRRGTDAPCLRIHRSFSPSRFHQPAPPFPTSGGLAI